MSQKRKVKRILKRIIPCVVLLFVLVFTAGCLKTILALGFLVGGPPSIEPDYERQSKKSLSDKGVTVAIVCYASKEIQFANTNIDKDIAKFVTHRLNQHKVRVVNPDLVSAWIDKNPEWESPEEIGEALGVTHVVYIDLQDFSLYAPESSTLYQGRTDALITVTEVEKDGSGDEIYSKDLNSKFPLMAPRSSSDTSIYKFKAEYLSFLSDQIGWLFYEHYNGDLFPYAH